VLLGGIGGTVSTSDGGGLEVHGLGAVPIGEAAAAAGIALHELTPQQASLEEAFMRMTHDATEYQAGEPEPTAARSTRSTSASRAGAWPSSRSACSAC
jgi:ABC-2 type transport system ATP-binding protein